MTRPLPERQTYTVPEAAALIGISDSLLYSEIRAGNIPSRRFGRRILLARSTVHELLGEAAPSPTNGEGLTTSLVSPS